MSREPTTTDDPVSRIQALESALAAECQARQAAEAADAAKSELLATVSHEVRTPMGAIISMADLLLASELEPTQRHYAETLQQSARGLLTVLNDILDYSKLEAGRFALEPVAVDFSELMESIAAALAARAAEKGLDSALTTAPDCPRQIVGDPVRIRQILDNLTDNALKFTAEGSVRIAVSCRAEGGTTVLRFEVSDTGIGISEAQIERLFRPYAQADRSVASKYGGTGLGLSIARRLAELMGGELGCESVEGEGSLFWFTARVRPAKPEAVPAHEQGAGQDGFGPLSGHVLVVEDNHVNLMLIAAYLEQFGLAFTTAKSGAEALQILGAEVIDLVLMDIMMPEMDGLETTRRIRAMASEKATVPIVALTANAMRGDRESYLAAGMDGYVSKPIIASDLFAALAEFLAPIAERSAVRG